ncbi:lipopolysaccharide kinase InaA family protein [Aromatoleum aromaticum]|uniref:lipopolysaccharide kinase InaA family protein n=1 Tax=Aromatoleum aromaticum TaxID=551760 RepID=UPI00059FDB02|nr:lipopolysaccharide kinase InaA family protein [Aromatoleum aromaticum]NMG55882.1 phosphotransferase [Aromatoleum aromaticum]
MNAPFETAATLRQAGRHPAVPFRIALDDGRVATVKRLLRVLPGKRLVGEAEVGGQAVLAKFFIARRGCIRHFEQERQGLAALAAQAIATPRLLGAGTLDGGHYLLTEFLDGAEDLAEGWHVALATHPDDIGAALGMLAPALETLGRMHARGLAQSDLHLGNFLRHRGVLYAIDGDAIRARRPGHPLGADDALRNLAILLAQLPRDADARLPDLLADYRTGNPDTSLDPALLQREIARVRNWRLRDYLAKTLRDCSLFHVEQRRDRFVSVVRQEAERLAPVIADPDLTLAAGSLLKDGGSSTVARIDIGARKLVIKRYNIKDVAHALSRFWRPSRAWHSWIEGHRLAFLGIATPQPLALIERRFGPLRGRAWLVTDSCDGPHLLQHLDAGREPPPAEARALRELFAALHRERISHGDLKATNLLWDQGAVKLIDLDAMRQHASVAAHARAWQKDRARLLRNWPEGCALRGWFEANVPPATQRPQRLSSI